MKRREGTTNAPQSNRTEKLTTGFSVENNNKKHGLKQRFCKCGAEIPRDAVIFENAKICGGCQQKQQQFEIVISTITKTPQKIEKSLFCSECKNLVPVRRMSAALVVCKPCLAAVQTKSVSAQNHFLTKITQSFQLLARRSLSGGCR